MIILISNDDGIFSPGLHELVRAVADLGQVWVVAPDREQSAVGHSITIADPIRLTDFNMGGAYRAFSVSGTPADCVKLALCELLPEPPNLVISGINRGENTGISIIYSGTVSAATEGAINGVPAIAVSLDSFTHEDFGPAAAVARKAAIEVLANGLPLCTLLNINVPALPQDRILGVKVIRQGQGRFKEKFIKRNDPRGRVYYWMDGDKLPLDETETDGTAILEGFVSVTPIHFDLTNHAALTSMKTWAETLHLSTP